MNNFPYFELINSDVPTQKLRRNLITASFSLLFLIHINYDHFQFPSDLDSTSLIIFDYFVKHGHNTATVFLFFGVLYLLVIHLFDHALAIQNISRQELTNTQELLRIPPEQRYKKDPALIKEHAKKNSRLVSNIEKFTTYSLTANTQDNIKIKEISQHEQLRYKKIMSIDATVRIDNYKSLTKTYTPIFIAVFTLALTLLQFFCYLFTT